jgi:hypothetical protein
LASAATSERAGDEQDRVVLPDRLVAQRHRQVRLAGPRRPRQQDRLAVGDEAGGRQLAHLPGVERGLGREVEAPQVAREREVRDPHRHLDPSLVAARDLPLAQERERFAQRQLTPGRLVEQAVELIADHCQPQPAEHADERLVVDHRHQPPPMARSYSASGRRRSGSASGIGAGAGPGSPPGRWKPGRPSKCAGSMSR